MGILNRLRKKEKIQDRIKEREIKAIKALVDAEIAAIAPGLSMGIWKR